MLNCSMIYLIIVLKDKPTSVTASGDEIKEVGQNLEIKLKGELVASFRMAEIQGWKSAPDEK